MSQRLLIEQERTEPIMSKLFVTMLAVLGMGVTGVATAIAADGPAMHYWHLWTDTNGVSHLTECMLNNFTLQSMNKPADPQWQDRQSARGDVMFTVQPANWHGTWHEDPRVQWVVPLEGTWFVEAQDGTRAEMGPGVPLLGEDQNSKPDSKNYRSHLSGNVGTGAVSLMVVQLDVQPTVGQPCHAK
jgi:hypothetical protein